MILGKEGEQPFEIKQEGVSRKHAEITINGDIWELSDLGSVNGTFVREDNGDFRSLGFHGKCIITPMTYISLGPDNSKGCGFYARQILSPNNYVAEYVFLNQKEDHFETELERIDKNTRNQNILKAVLPVVLFGLSFAVFPGGGAALWIIRAFASAIPTVIILLFYNSTEKKKALTKSHDKFTHCPNPACSHHLKPEEIRNMKCNKCRQ